MHYTIPRTTRELQRDVTTRVCSNYYTIPRTTRELQPRGPPGKMAPQLYHTKNYQGTTTGQLLCSVQGTIIPYQELPGNYNPCAIIFDKRNIIPYQELPGNYNAWRQSPSSAIIIPYQELPGNYNPGSAYDNLYEIIPYQGLPGNYNQNIVHLHNGCIIPYQEPPGNYNGIYACGDAWSIIPYQDYRGTNPKCCHGGSTWLRSAAGHTAH